MRRWFVIFTAPKRTTPWRSTQRSPGGCPEESEGEIMARVSIVASTGRNKQSRLRIVSLSTFSGLWGLRAVPRCRVLDPRVIMAGGLEYESLIRKVMGV